MAPVKHINVPDKSGQVYCCLRNRIVRLDDEQWRRFCDGCGMYAGRAGGQGVACVWEDARLLPDPYVVTDPEAELRSNQRKQVAARPASGDCSVPGL